MTGFPGTWNGAGGGGKRSRHFGAFLARRGDELEEEERRVARPLLSLQICYIYLPLPDSTTTTASYVLVYILDGWRIGVFSCMLFF